jgi:hypothetical protein
MGEGHGTVSQRDKAAASLTASPRERERQARSGSAPVKSSGR